MWRRHYSVTVIEDTAEPPVNHRRTTDQRWLTASHQAGLRPGLVGLWAGSGQGMGRDWIVGYSNGTSVVTKEMCLNILDNTDLGLEYLSGLVAVKYISDLIIPLCEVSFTGFLARSGPKLFGGTMGVFTEELSEILYFLITRPDPYSAATSFCGVLQIGIKSQACLSEVLPETSMSGSKDSTVTYTEAANPYADLPGYIPESDPEEDPEEDDKEDPKEDPADYPADRGDDDDDDAEEEHLAPADPTDVAYSADQDPYLAYRVTARMSIRPQTPAPFLSEEDAERFLAIPTPPPSPLFPYSSPLPQIPSP
ncbi:hypothetical protein Tco_0950518, partial [Tanacetum coccineum]